MDTPVNTAAKKTPPDTGAVATEIHDTTDFTQLPSMLFRSLAAVVLGTLVLRLASQTMGQMLQYYLAEIDRNYYAISYTTRGLIIAAFFIPELFGSPLLGAISTAMVENFSFCLAPFLAP
jgi:hypothetical protein